MAKTINEVKRQTILSLLCTALFLALVISVSVRLVLFAANRFSDEDLLTVDVIDVGQSDAVLLRCGGQTMLIDSGTASAGEDLIFELQSLGVTHVHCLVITHPHEDHYGNTRALLSVFTVGEVMVPDVPVDDFGYTLLLSSLSESEIPVITAQTGQVFALGGATAEVLAAGGQDPNNGSVILRVAYGENVLLFMGDAEAAAEAALLTAYDSAYLDCDFLKVGHHGSDTATTVAFANVTTPLAAAISCGADNEYGFPHAAVLENLSAVGANVYRTDLAGTLRFAADGNALYLRKE